MTRRGVKDRVAMRAAATALLLVFTTLPLPAWGARSQSAGFEQIRIPNGAEPPLVGGVWYPTDAPASEHRLGSFAQTVALGAPVLGRDLLLVVLSHGGGGSYESHYDTALALAHAGFVVAAITHSGDAYGDESRTLEFWRRPAQLRRLLTYMLNEWPQHDRLDARRAGAFGFSNGGFTVLVAAGGVPDLAKMAPYCRAHPEHDLCQALRQAGVDPKIGSNVPPEVWIHDPRIQAAVIAAPAFGFAFNHAGLKDVHIPIQLWRAADDRHQPSPWYDEAVRDALPKAPEYHVVPRAGHYDFLPPCPLQLRAGNLPICEDRLGFNRAAFHREFNSEVVRFFEAHFARRQ